MPRHARRLLAAASITTLVVLSTAVPATATYPGANGRLTFMRFDENGHGQIYVADADMSNEAQLTSGRDDGGFPAWSPDGSRIAFQSSRTDPDLEAGPEIQDIFTMRPDGTDVRQITDSVGDAEKPAWSPDGRWIAYAADRANYPAGQGIYLIRSDGSGAPRQLTTLPKGSFWQELARFSPDGQRIAYTEYRGGHVLSHHRDGEVVGEQAALFSVKRDGTGIRQLTPWGIHGSDADWSPDGSKLVFSGQPTHIGDIGDIQTVRADGTHLTDLTKDGTLTGLGRDSAVRYIESFNAVWSPDGTTIVFVRAEYTAKTGFRMGLMTMNPDGSGRRWLSQGEEHQPDWGPAVP
jgi:TolB protein